MSDNLLQQLRQFRLSFRKGLRSASRQCWKSCHSDLPSERISDTSSAAAATVLMSSLRCLQVPQENHKEEPYRANSLLNVTENVHRILISRLFENICMQNWQNTFYIRIRRMSNLERHDSVHQCVLCMSHFCYEHDVRLSACLSA